MEGKYDLKFDCSESERKPVQREGLYLRRGAVEVGEERADQAPHGQEEAVRASREVRENRVILLLTPLPFRWLKVNFGECFTAWIHVKALRVFVESVLRFGLPVNFQGMVLAPQRKQIKKLRETLNELYIHLDSAAALGGSEDLPTGLAGFGQGEYYPYVYYKINIDMVGPSSSNI